MALNYVEHQKTFIKKDLGLDEKWVMDAIKKNPSITGLADYDIKAAERESLPPPSSEWFEMLFYIWDYYGEREIFAVEIELGERISNDESLIIKAIEFWNKENKSDDGYENHYAVIIAENITNSFLDTISLFKGLIPFIVLQMDAVKIGNDVSLVFTTILDWRDIKTERTLTTDEALQLIKTASIGKFATLLDDLGKTTVEKINNLKSKKDSDFSLGQIFAYYDIMRILEDQGHYALNLYGCMDFMCFPRYWNESDYMPSTIKNEYKIVKKAVEKCDPLEILHKPFMSVLEYEELIIEIAFWLKCKSGEDMVDVIYNAFIKFHNRDWRIKSNDKNLYGRNEDEKVFADNCMNIAKKIKEGIEEIQKAQ
jgi:hypothetical protein